MFENIDFQKLSDSIVLWAPKFVSAILILFIGIWIANNVTKMLKAMMTKANIDATLRPFLASLAGVLLKLMVVIAAAGQVGIETTSFIAILGAAGLAIGLALQGSLQNFSAGAMLLIFKPYKVGDLVMLQGHKGHVKSIQIFNTIILTRENETIIIPNASATSGAMTNFSTAGLICLDLTFGVAYSADIDQVRKVIQEVADANEKILKTPPIGITVSGHGASSVDFSVRPYCHPDDYWPVYAYMHEALKKAFDKANIGIPYTTYDINILK